MPQPEPPGPPPYTLARMPTVEIPQPTWQPQPPSSYTATSSAPAASSSSGDYAQLLHVVGRLQREMTEMKEKIVVLENTVHALQNAVPEQWDQAQQNEDLD